MMKQVMDGNFSSQSVRPNSLFVLSLIYNLSKDVSITKPIFSQKIKDACVQYKTLAVLSFGPKMGVSHLVEDVAFLG